MFGLEETFKIIWFQPLPWAGTSSNRKAAQSPIQLKPLVKDAEARRYHPAVRAG